MAMLSQQLQILIETADIIGDTETGRVVRFMADSITDWCGDIVSYAEVIEAFEEARYQQNSGSLAGSLMEFVNNLQVLIDRQDIIEHPTGVQTSMYRAGIREIGEDAVMRVAAGLTNSFDPFSELSVEVILTAAKREQAQSEFDLLEDNAVHLALSYKHEYPKIAGSTISREKARNILRAIQAVPGIQPGVKVRLWIDQNISALKIPEDEWYTYGLIPYCLLRVISIDIAQPRTITERPWLWIEAGMSCCGDGLHTLPGLDIRNVEGIQSIGQSVRQAILNHGWCPSGGTSPRKILYEGLPMAATWDNRMLNHGGYNYREDFEKFSRWAARNIISFNNDGKFILEALPDPLNIMEAVDVLRYVGQAADRLRSGAGGGPQIIRRKTQELREEMKVSDLIRYEGSDNVSMSAFFKTGRVGDIYFYVPAHFLQEAYCFRKIGDAFELAGTSSEVLHAFGDDWRSEKVLRLNEFIEKIVNMTDFELETIIGKAPSIMTVCFEDLEPIYVGPGEKEDLELLTESLVLLEDSLVSRVRKISTYGATRWSEVLIRNLRLTGSSNSDVESVLGQCQVNKSIRKMLSSLNIEKAVTTLHAEDNFPTIYRGIDAAKREMKIRLEGCFDFCGNYTRISNVMGKKLLITRRTPESIRIFTAPFTMQACGVERVFSEKSSVYTPGYVNTKEIKYQLGWQPIRGIRPEAGCWVNSDRIHYDDGVDDAMGNLAEVTLLKPTNGRLELLPLAGRYVEFREDSRMKHINWKHFWNEDERGAEDIIMTAQKARIGP